MKHVTFCFCLCSLYKLTTADTWQILGNWEYDATNDLWDRPLFNTYDLVVLSDYQWYDPTNSFTMNYTTTIDFESSVDDESGLILFNDDAGSLCNSYYISLAQRSNGGTRLAGSKTF